MDWTPNYDEVYDVDSHWAWRAWKYTAPPSDWNHESQWLRNLDYGGDTAIQKYHVDYINWTWQWNYNKTEVFHRIKITANPDGALSWDTSWWHTGEDAGALSAEVGFIY